MLYPDREESWEAMLRTITREEPFMPPIDRRDFMKGTAGAVMGLAGVEPALVFGRGRAARLRLGFIGVGGRGTGLLRLALNRDDIEVTALCDID